MDDLILCICGGNKWQFRAGARDDSKTVMSCRPCGRSFYGKTPNDCVSNAAAARAKAVGGDDLPELTDAELREIENRAANATEGPWAVDQHWERVGRDGKSDIVVCASQVGEYVQGQARVADCEYDDSDDEQNALFIAHARTDVPRLVAEVRRLRAQNP